MRPEQILVRYREPPRKARKLAEPYRTAYSIAYHCAYNSLDELLQDLYELERLFRDLAFNPKPNANLPYTASEYALECFREALSIILRTLNRPSWYRVIYDLNPKSRRPGIKVLLRTRETPSYRVVIDFRPTGTRQLQRPHVFVYVAKFNRRGRKYFECFTHLQYNARLLDLIFKLLQPVLLAKQLPHLRKPPSA